MSATSASTTLFGMKTLTTSRNGKKISLELGIQMPTCFLRPMGSEGDESKTSHYIRHFALMH